MKIGLNYPPRVFQSYSLLFIIRYFPSLMIAGCLTAWCRKEKLGCRGEELGVEERNLGEELGVEERNLCVEERNLGTEERNLGLVDKV
jgi:hypothetical protein